MKKILSIIFLLISTATFAQIKVLKVIGQQGIAKADSVNGYVTPSELGKKRDTSYHQSLVAIKPIYFNIINKDSFQIGAYTTTDTTFNNASDTSLPSSLAVKRYVDKDITPNMFKGLGLSDNQKIQAALNLSVSKHKKLIIPFNEERGSNVWLLDSAILLKSNSYIVIQNTTLKLTDSSRDNVFRTENCGLGITNPEVNPLQNITIEGFNATIEGADNPRSTGDVGKTLVLTGNLNTNVSYGTDSGKVGRSQTGDWRNIGLLFAYTSNIKISGLTLLNLHAWTTSFERCDHITIRDIILNNPEKRSYANYVKNTDGFDFRNGCHDFTIENVTGTTGDDAVALTVIDGVSVPAGVVNSMAVTKVDVDSLKDDIYNFTIRNIKSNTYHNIVRLLNTGKAKIYNGTISDVRDITIGDSLVRKPTGSVIVLGSATGSYAGATPLGYLRNITINNLTDKNYPYAINVQGSIAESSISNVIKDSVSTLSGVQIPSIYFHPLSNGSRNLQLSNIFEPNGTTNLVAIRSGNSLTGISRDSLGVFKVIDSAQAGLKYAADYSGNFTARSLVDKQYVDLHSGGGTGGVSRNADSLGGYPANNYYLKTAIDGFLAGKASLSSNNTFTGVNNFSGFINIINSNPLRFNSGNAEIVPSGYDLLYRIWSGSALVDRFKMTSDGKFKYVTHLTYTAADSLAVTDKKYVDTNAPTLSTGTSAPTMPPTKAGDIFVDTANKKLYFAAGNSSSSDWIIAN